LARVDQNGPFILVSWRVRVIPCVEGGGYRREAAEQFDVQRSSALRWGNAFREEGTRRSQYRWRSIRHWRRQLAADFSPSSVSMQDFKLGDDVSGCNKRRDTGSRSALSRFFARHGITVQKKSAGAERKRSRRARARRRCSTRSKACLTHAALYLSTRPAVTTKMVRRSRLEPARRSACLGGLWGRMGNGDVYRWLPSTLGIVAASYQEP